MRILLGNIPVTLLSGHGVLIEATGTLVVSDIHLGKSATFRSRGIPIPEGDTCHDLANLSRLILDTQAKQLVIAGDLFHAKQGMSPHVMECIREWAAELSIPATLTEGNHDRKPLLSELSLPLEILPFIDIEGIRITHDPGDLHDDTAGIAGHLHPGAKVVESPRRSLRVPAFYLKHPHHLVLPAFSRFTGMHMIRPDPKDKFYIPLAEKVVEL